MHFMILMQCVSIKPMWSKQENCSKFDHCAVANQKQEPVIAMEPQQLAMEEVNSVLRFRTPWDFVASLAFVGIFIVENILHAMDFEFEVNNMVMPAVDPLPYEFAVSLHMVHMIFGLCGAALVLMSGFHSAGRRALPRGTSMMLVFMVTITWTWWINRQGTLYWDLDPYWFWDKRCSFEKRNRTVHIFKNLSIAGAFYILQQLARNEPQGEAPSVERLIMALRPWTFQAVLGPQLVLLAVLRSVLQYPLPGYTVIFALALALLSLQAAVNLMNSYVDFWMGIDTSATASDRTLVDGLVSITTLRILLAICLAFWFGFFLWSLVATGFSSIVLCYAFFGTLLAVGYAAGLKFVGLGDLTVLICFGPGLISYSSAVLVGSVPFATWVLTIPTALYVVAILHANNVRDIQSDREGGAWTLAVHLGPIKSRRYFIILVALAHILAMVAGWIYGCYGSFATLSVLPRSICLCIRVQQPANLRDQDAETAKAMMLFSVILALGLITMPGTEISLLPMGISILVVLLWRWLF